MEMPKEYTEDDYAMRDEIILTKLKEDFELQVASVAGNVPIAKKLVDAYDTNEEEIDDLVFEFWMNSGMPNPEIESLGMQQTKEYLHFWRDFLLWVERNVEFEEYE